MSHDTIQQSRQILGYTLTRKIGSGGYGDVWEAQAPGGLRKAVKIVHGYHDERRAQSELKALDKIKEARHPFLLSLERIEVVEGKLIIVSEMADRCLADLANDYSQRGETGIPRDELLVYINEAADALDYLNATFGLQHLDIKPENILLVSGHAKVADFGLVRDLRDISQSMMSGMTPTYAAPEMFDGRPGPASDQYSLAIVYQEMLTMVRPFNGTTPAQLAAQHVHGKPDLRSLPISDQAVVTKALSKDPADRYKSCRQFVEQLLTRKTRKKLVKTAATTRKTIETTDKTVVFDKGPNQSSELLSRGVTARFQSFTNVDLDALAPPECDAVAAVLQPTMVIGVGRSSSLVLQKIRQRLIARHGEVDMLPAVRLLCIDSDRDSLAELSVGRGTDSIRVSETLAIPLRRSEQYRQRKNLDLSWISRRWIYNVPRSLQTEGLRPLGRVAFVDHYDAICEKLTAIFNEAMLAENIATSCETLGLNPPLEIRPRVVLISNIAGGLGSGMVNDLAFTIRLVATELGIKTFDLIGLLMYGCEPGRDISLATANAFSYLAELRHFADGGYPGDRRLGIPEFDEELPFDHVYALRLGQDSNAKSFSDIDKLAEYVCLSTTTNCSVFFDAVRQQERTKDEFSFRSLGVSICGPGLQIQGRDAVNRLSNNLIERWIGKPAETVPSQEQIASNFLEFLGLSLESVANRILAELSELDEWKQVQLEMQAIPSRLTEKKTNLQFSEIDECFDILFDKPRWRNETQMQTSELGLAAENEINVASHEIGDRLSQYILRLFNEGAISFHRVQHVLEACREAVQKEHEAILNGLHGYGSTLQEMRGWFEQSEISQRRDFQLSFIEQLGKARSEEFILRCCNDFYRVIKSCLLSTLEIIKKYRMQLGIVGQSFQAPPIPKKSAKKIQPIQELVIESVERKYDQLLPQIESIVLDEIRADGGQFLEFLSESFNWQQTLPNIIRAAAQSVLSTAFKGISIEQVFKEHNLQLPAINAWLNQHLTDAQPLIRNCGGGASLLIGQPQHSMESTLPQTIRQHFDLDLKEIRGTTGDVVFCFDAEGIPLANVAFSILKDAPEAIELARRIHSRTDIEWTSLDDLI